MSRRIPGWSGRVPASRTEVAPEPGGFVVIVNCDNSAQVFHSTKALAVRAAKRHADRNGLVATLREPSPSLERVLDDGRAERCYTFRAWRA